MGKGNPDIVILDLGLPDMDGFDVLREIRSFSNVPLIILTVRGDETSRIKGLELGADDYIVKPFSPVELLARVKAVLRRSHMPQLAREEKPLVAGPITIDTAQRRVYKNGKPVKLTPIEYNLLCQLVKSKGRVLPQSVLLSKIWGSEYSDATEYLKVYIQRLRQKLEDDPKNPKMILSERGVGYKFNPPE